MKIIIVMNGGLIQNIVTDTEFFNLKDHDEPVDIKGHPAPRIIVKDYDVEGDNLHPSITEDRNGTRVAVTEWGLELWDETQADFDHFDKFFESGGGV